MNTVAAVRIRIMQLCAQKGLTIHRLAYLSAVPPSTIQSILYGKSQNPTIVTIKMLCDGLNITLGTFFSTALFDALEQELQ
nr:helix-turn-helix transcriptional regulator [Maliibacterium massiliense]